MRNPYLARVEGLPVGKQNKYPFRNGDTVLVLGEIEQMPGHVAVALELGNVVFGYHAEWFRKLTDDEA